nr:hypothetical protein [Brachybacterium sp. p3-SID957]
MTTVNTTVRAPRTGTPTARAIRMTTEISTGHTRNTCAWIDRDQKWWNTEAVEASAA